MSRSRGDRWVLGLSLLLALLAGILPLPAVIEPLRPFWLGLLLIYWALEAPDRAGLGLAFVLGLFADVLFGTLFGEHALRLCVMVFLVLRFRPRLRFFPLTQQALAVFALLLNDKVVCLAVRIASGDGVPPAAFWWSPLAGLLLWPWLFLLLDRWRQRQRYRDG